jgi:hypothetical protein
MLQVQGYSVIISLSSNSIILSINNLNNRLSTNSTWSINNLNNKTNFTNILVSNASTLLSSLNLAGNIVGSGAALTNLNFNAILNPPLIVSFYNPSTFASTLNILGNTTLNNATTYISSLHVSSITTLSGIGTISSGSILQVGDGGRLKLEVE